jgi:glycosyltransferase involved in cell wall biosynthesis
MRIAIVIDSLAPGGAERQAFYTARELAKKGAQADLVYYHNAPVEFDAALIAPARALYVSKGRGPLGFILRLRALLKAHQYDVVHGFKDSPSFYACVAGRLAGVPVALGGYRSQYAGSGLIRICDKIVDRLADGWIVNARSIIPTLVAGIGARTDRIDVVHNGIELKAFQIDKTPHHAKVQLGLDPDTAVVSIVAVLREEKNHDMFLAVVAELVRSNRQVTFLIVGDGPRRDYLHRRVEQLGLSNHVRFLGMRHDIPQILAASTVSLLTSPREGSANILIESMAAGVPVVTTDFAGVEDMIQDGREGFIVPIDDVPAMTRRVGDLLDQPALREEMGRHGKSKARSSFSMDRMTHDLLAVYRKHLLARGVPCSEI